MLKNCDYSIYHENVFPFIQVNIRDCYQVNKNIIEYAKEKFISIDKDKWNYAFKQFLENSHLNQIQFDELQSLFKNKERKKDSVIDDYIIIEDYNLTLN
ncbi:hypothetical protein ACQUW5_14355 [Legionella sp. CNM-1927-20]|uniref:hypothetical protein n=1 Tax=Legionella sp. CNM-1927-20 TaxID=3422221 RepID=UPI00403B1A34